MLHRISESHFSQMRLELYDTGRNYAEFKHGAVGIVYF